MKIFIFADGKVAEEVIRFLKGKKEEIVGIILHSPSKQNNVRFILDAVDLPKEKIFTWGEQSEEELCKKIIALNPDIALSIFWTYILPPSIFNLFEKGCINFHSSYLPFNRGKNPNVWPIIDNTPAGITLHYIDEGIDTGSIISQQEIEVEPVDTAKEVYEKLISSFIFLFKKTWSNIKNDNIKPIKQENAKSTFHSAKDFKKLNEIDLNKKYYPLELINLLRSRTFRPYPSAYYIKDDKKISVRIDLEYTDNE